MNISITLLKCWADSLLAGCALAVILSKFERFEFAGLRKLLAYSMIPCLLTVGTFVFIINYYMRWYYKAPFLYGTLPGVFVVAAITHGAPSRINRFLEIPFLVYMGRICYGVYIYHFMIFQFLRLDFGCSSWGVFLIGWPLTIGLAMASYRWVERPFMTSRPL